MQASRLRLRIAMTEGLLGCGSSFASPRLAASARATRSLPDGASRIGSLAGARQSLPVRSQGEQAKKPKRLPWFASLAHNSDQQTNQADSEMLLAQQTNDKRFL